MQRIHGSAQAREESPALGALAEVMFHPLLASGGELSIEIVRHAVWRPTMISPEPLSIRRQVAH
jgi:hypothetical protein